MFIFHFSLFILFSIYSLVIIWLIIGNRKLKGKFNDTPYSVSVIVPIRNGEETLSDLINDLSLQNYNGEFEIILVDDNSDDNTLKIIKSIVKRDNRFKYQTSNNGNPALNFKKRALDAGIKVAKNEWLLFTDADCRLTIHWIAGMVSYFNAENDYVIGHSYVKRDRGILNMFETIDLLLLLLCARGAVGNNYPLACIGQNQAYKKSLYHKVGGFSKISNHIQGDDSLFMNICKKEGNANIVFASNKKCHVHTNSIKKWVPLFKQRLRWGGDGQIMWKINILFYFILLVFFLLHLKLIILLFFLCLSHGHYLLLGKYLLIKFILEFGLYHAGSKYLNNSINLIHFIVWYVIHIFYVVLIGFGSFYYKQLSWKGRRIIVSNNL